MDGLLVVDKPAGPTSHDVVAVVRRVLKTSRVGHTGTLDPLATGVLVLCIGSGTRLAEYVQAMGKVYRTGLLLGARSDDLLREVTAGPADQLLFRGEREVHSCLQWLVARTSH